MQDEVGTKSETVSSNDPKSLFCPEKVNKRLAEAISGFELPEWILYAVDGSKRTCHECGEPLDYVSIRTVSLCLNPQHLGDAQVEILCRQCSAAYYVNFRKACANTRDFIRLMDGERPSFDPVCVSDIKHDDNNLTAMMIEEDLNKKVADLAIEVAETMAGYGKKT